jgi:sugar lactone lactonase YvrE
MPMTPRGFVLWLAVAWAGVAGMGGCGGSKPASPPGDRAADVGALSMALTATTNGHDYRLRQATFTIVGPSNVVLSSETQPDASALTAQLDVGSYTAQLGGAWSLERLDPSGPVQVAATLTSANPASFEITSGVTTGVPFRFSTDGTLVTIGTGSVAITTVVSETTGSLSLLAGKLGGLGSGDGVGADARFFEPTGAVSDGAGNLYVADTSNNTIRRVALDTLAVTTLAGTPTLTGADDGVGEAARFNSPRGPGLDGAGNLYVADRFNLVIREISIATGAVTTLAGTLGVSGALDGVGLAAQFTDPTAVAGDGAGNVYVTDGNTIRKIVVATGEVTTLAGLASDPFGSDDGIGSAARFSEPQGIAADGAGNLYVADTNNQTIRKIVIATGAVTTVAGLAHQSGAVDGAAGDARFSEPWSLTADGAGSLFVADAENNAVRRIALETGQVTTLAGGTFGATDGIGTAAQFNFPEGIAGDGAGNVWVTDTANNAVREVVVATAQVTTPVGALVSLGPTGPLADGVGPAADVGFVPSMASDGAANVYLSSGTVIRKLVVATGAITTIAGAPDDGDGGTVLDGVGSAARFGGLHGLTWDGGVLYLCDADTTIRQLVLATGQVTTIAGAPGVSGSADGIGPAASFDSVTSVASDGAGNLYVADFFNGLIRRVEIATGAVTTIAGTLRAFTTIDGVGANAAFFSPQALVYDGAGSLYVMDGTALRKVVLATGAVTTVAGTTDSGAVDGIGSAARFSLADGLTIDGAGDLFVADTQGHTIRKVVLATLAVTTVVGDPIHFGVHPGPLPARLSLPPAVVALPGGGLIIADEAALLLATF